MKFSSISLIVATIVAVAGNTIAAPGPLHARALEELERDLDIYRRGSRVVDEQPVDDLFTRSSTDYHHAHSVVAHATRISADANHQAADDARQASKDADTAHEKEKWNQVSDMRRAIAKALERDHLEHTLAKRIPHRTPLHANVEEDLGNAISTLPEARRDSSDAKAFSASASLNRHK